MENDSQAADYYLPNSRADWTSQSSQTIQTVHCTLFQKKITARTLRKNRCGCGRNTKKLLCARGWSYCPFYSREWWEWDICRRISQQNSNSCRSLLLCRKRRYRLRWGNHTPISRYSRLRHRIVAVWTSRCYILHKNFSETHDQTKRQYSRVYTGKSHHRLRKTPSNSEWVGPHANWYDSKQNLKQRYGLSVS